MGQKTPLWFVIHTSAHPKSEQRIVAVGETKDAAFAKALSLYPCFRRIEGAFYLKLQPAGASLMLGESVMTMPEDHLKAKIGRQAANALYLDYLKRAHQKTA